MTAASYHLQRLDMLRATARSAHAPDRENVVSKFLVDAVEPQSPAVAVEEPVVVAAAPTPNSPAVQNPPIGKSPLRVSELVGGVASNSTVRSRGYVSLRDSLGAGPEHQTRHPAVADDADGWVAGCLKAIRGRG